MFEQFTSISLSDIPSGFIKFTTLNILIDHQQLDEEQPIYLSIDHAAKRGPLSDVCLDQRKPNGAMKHFAYFYTYCQYTKGLKLLLDSFDNLDFYRLFMKGTNNPNNTISVELTFYIKDTFLLKLYEEDEIPLIIYKLLIEKGISSSNATAPTSVNVCTPFPIYTINTAFKIPPFQYQRQNYSWMINMENRITSNNLRYQTFEKPNSNHIKYYCLEEINEVLLLDQGNNKMIHTESLPTRVFNYAGGVLADEVGLGKTFSMISLIEAQLKPDVNASLVLCPRRLCLQWQNEIIKTSNLRSYIIYSITQYKKLTTNTIKNYDVIIMSYPFLTHAKYLEFCEATDNDYITKQYCWERLILDEGHEYLTNSNILKKSHHRETLRELYQFNSNYRWICSGTPISTYLDFWEISRFLENNSISEQDRDISSYSIRDSILAGNYETNRHFNHAVKDLLKLLFRKNTKLGVAQEVNIPEPNIETRFLNMTTIERAIYDSALDNKEKQIQLCNHILVSEHHINILGNDPISLTDTHEKMVTYYDKKIKYQEKRLENIEVELTGLQVENNNLDMTSNNYSEIMGKLQSKMETLTEKKQEITEELSENKRKYEIFAELQQSIDQEKHCPICYEDLEPLFKAVTPCGHFICSECIQGIVKHSHSNQLECPMCRAYVDKTQLNIISPERLDMTMKLGTKMAELIKYSNEVLEANTQNRIIIFSQWDSMLQLVSKNLTSFQVNHLILNGSYHTLNKKLRRFRLDASIRIILLSSDKAASGLNLTEANHIVLLDTLNNDPKTSKVIENQAIGRSVRIGQTDNVEIKRFIMTNTVEEEFYHNFIKT